MFSTTPDFLRSKIKNRFKTFSVNGEKFHYFSHQYNTTWRNERAIEIPFLWSKVLTAYQNNLRVLEIGNVFSHYFPIHHEVVDKYETALDVKNVDVVKFNPGKKYDLIVSVSTLEHVGLDEVPKDHRKVKQAISHLRTLFNPGGELWFSGSVAYNRNLDKLLVNKQIRCEELIYMRRITQANDWLQTDATLVGQVEYNKPFCNANAIYFAKVI